MNEGPDFQPLAEDDDARDPLLGALRQRLGEHFGQEPPPEVWAGIRRQLPAAPRPWWQGRRLLALLLGLVTLGVFWARRDGWPNGPASRGAAASRSAQSGASRHPASDALAAQAGTPERAAGPQLASRSQTAAATAVPGATSTAAPAAGRRAPLTRRADGNALALSLATVNLPRASARASQPQHSTALYPQRRLASGRDQRSQLASRVRRPAVTAQRSRPVVALPAGFRPQAPAADARTTGRRAGASPPPAAGRPAYAGLPTSPTALGAIQDASAGTRPASRGQAAVAALSAAGPVTAQPGGALDSLARRRAALLLASQSRPPAALAASADSTGPWLLLVRRWSVLVLAGPALSYRTLRPVSTGGLAYSAAPTTTTPATYANGSGPATSLADQERPALGWGAQVQVRRVLSGRWALAGGVGYQEYATWLTAQVQVARSAAYSTVLSDTIFTLNQRETYRFLTLPVQLSYALGPPRGRFSLGVLGGFEPSWYQGSSASVLTSTTDGRLTLAPAANSPYNTFSVALSLGLDARYRLGGPASRWQWVVQPTGRYVATTLVRSSSLYARRQPYSLGVLTGLAWSFH